ncbi:MULTISPECIES: SDR family oxidoreductase [Staphylococcus]|uniref:Oxidoreductase, short chain dehydrogenase/reductase family protein n=1 Tax=Staphylococcus lugdunensis TaxID=28035 RepID=A0ABD4EGI9_STALU|nr:MULTISPECIES: SDR family oxidoreductase [Staphylococcus]ARB76972.1 SDR family NAD(P)-dependent oxidoreductase [Staphylococcus lugdunensis]ARJ18019.1 oxidoreductase [Staphylococcus lugdunensis]EFU83799.1 oxidoreductase, short chain dehydrogenase/reductase family protein [Staphylococcus lugdunensis M23590]KXA38332.1 oxidoreductase, short chain dehydrogenase/reductase family protein [Staphylococcus lugdunensis]MBM7134697.1 SDR family oxidoreductase [Staphylococcus lugdunensis]
MDNIVGRVAVITGASSGIGKEIAKAMHSMGFRVVLAGRNRKRLNQVAMHMRKYESLIVEIDMTQRQEVEALIAKAIEYFGRVDILVNSAGLSLSSQITSHQVEDWDAMIDTNLKGTLYAINAVLPHFQQYKEGHIINLASISAEEVTKDSTVYSATKAAVQMISRGLEKDLARTGIKVTSILPGMVDTPMTEQSDFGGRKKLETYDIAESIRYAITQPPHVNVNQITIRPV